MKKVISLLLSFAMLLSITAGLNLTAYADVQTGKCGDNVTYSLDTSTGVLTISGTGKMTDYKNVDSPFYNDSRIKSVVIEYGVTSIGYSAFYECTSLTSVTMLDSVTSIGDFAFGYGASLTNITIPDSVTSIGNAAFVICASLTSITIPNSVTSIGIDVFYGCTSLTSINVDEGNANYLSKDGVLFNNKNELVRYPIGNTRTSYNIPNSATSIGYCAFEDCTSLTSITIPDSVTSIGNVAFENCASLASVTIPNSVTSIGAWVFYNCTSLTDVYYTGSQEEWNKITIGSDNECLTNATIHYNWGVEDSLITDKDETSFTVYNSTAIIDSVNDVNLKLKSVNMNIAENSSQFDKKKVVKKNDIKGKEIKFTKDDFRDYIIPAKVTSDSKYLKSSSHNIYMTKDTKDGKPYISSVYVQQLDDNNEPKTSYCDVQYSSMTLIDNAKYNIAISAVTNGAKNVKYYLIQNDGNSKYKTEITNGVADKIKLASKVQDGKSLYAYVVCDGVASDIVPLKLDKRKLSSSVKKMLKSSTVNILGGETGKFKLSDSVPILGGTEASLDFIKCPVGVELTGNKVKISVGFDIFGYSDSTDKDGDTDTKWLSFKNSCKQLSSGNTLKVVARR